LYSSAISQRDIADIELSLGRTLDWWPVDECLEINRTLNAVFNADGSTNRPLTEVEQRFIHDERLRCQLDARYWLDRYAWVRRDDVRGGEGVIELWESQKVILQHVAYCEEAMWASYDRQRAAGYDESMIRVSGICLALLKARQLGASVLILLLLLHRFVFWTNLRLVAASADETKTQEMFELYFVFAYKRLPVWMRPEVTSKTKDVGMRAESLDTTLFLQNAKMESGIGMGGTSHGGLITEVGSYPKSVTEQMQNHFFRSVPWSLVTFIVLESLAQGQGNFWHSFALSAIKGGTDAGRWHGVFIPWYIEPKKYRSEPPAGWQPSRETLRYAYKVYETSSKYVGEYVDGQWVGRRVTLDEYQLYWYESERAKAEKDGALEDFLTNYPPTPEEAFQSKSGAPFSAQVLERLSNDCTDPIKQFEWLFGPNDRDRGMRPADLSMYPDDPRGVLRVYEKPRKDARYKMGVDTAPGIPNWSRRMPQIGDRQKDNCAIEVVRVGYRGEPDVQVAEFMAPIDYVAAAPIVNWVGRLFRGRDEEMCECIVETGPTSGEALQERLLNEHNYWNLYRKANMATYSHSTSFGWVPNEKSRLDLWYRTRPHISYVKLIEVGGKEIRKVKFVARSRYLVDTEFRNCEVDPKLMTAKAAFGFHDDCVRAIQLAIYAAHDWQTFGEMSDAAANEVPREKRPEYQASDMTLAEMTADIDARLEPEGGDVW
jgi:hypothetical protein